MSRSQPIGMPNELRILHFSPRQIRVLSALRPCTPSRPGRRAEGSGYPSKGVQLSPAWPSHLHPPPRRHAWRSESLVCHPVGTGPTLAADYLKRRDLLISSAGTCVVLRHTSPNLICVSAPEDVWSDQLYELAERVRACREPWLSLSVDNDPGEDAGVIQRGANPRPAHLVVEVAA
jgi:hypothetical protein